jgi:tripartite-type tricarboxylate transporter receptor subunit TctC
MGNSFYMSLRLALQLSRSQTISVPCEGTDMHRLLRSAIVTGLTFLSSVSVHAQIQEPTRIIFPYAAGGSGDALTRLVAEQLRTGLNRPVIVENKTGAAGRLGVQAVKTAAPNGNTLLMSPIAPMVLYQHLYPSLEYDPFNDFQPITQVATFDHAVAVGPQVPAKSLKDLISWVKDNPAQGNYGTAGAGTLNHFLAILFARATALDLHHIAYRGTPAALADVVGGQIAIVFAPTNELVEMHKAGRIRILATSSNERSPFLSDVPTFQEAGFAIRSAGWHGMFAPTKTPKDLVQRLNTLIVTAIQMPETKNRILALGLQPTGTSAEDFARIQRSDSELWAPAVKASGFTPEQ